MRPRIDVSDRIRDSSKSLPPSPFKLNDARRLLYEGGQRDRGLGVWCRPA